MNKKELRYKAKRAILNVLSGAGYEFLIEEFGVDDGSAIHNEVKAIIDDMADKLYNPKPPAPRKPKASRVQDSKPQAETVSSEPIARYEPSGEYVNVNAKRGRHG